MKPFYGYSSRTIVFLIALLGASDVLAEPDMFAPERVGRPYWHIGAGAYIPDGNSQLGNQEGRFDLLLGGGYRHSANMAWELDFLSAWQNFDTPATISPPFLGSVDPRSSLSTEGVSGTAKFIYPLGRLEVYAGGGMGIYSVKFRATGQQLGFPGALERSSTALGVHLVAGADFYVTDKSALGIELRNTKVNASLGSIVPGDIKAGGSCVSLLLRFAI